MGTIGTPPEFFDLVRGPCVTDAPLNVNSEFRIPMPERSANSEGANFRWAAVFGLRASDFFRISGSEFGFQVQGFSARKSFRAARGWPWADNNRGSSGH